MLTNVNYYKKKRREISKVIKKINKELVDFPNDPERYSELAKAYYFNKDYENARKYATISIDILSTMSDPYWILASVSIVENEPETVYIPLAEKGYQLAQDGYEVIVTYAIVCLLTNDHEKGLLLLDRAIEIYPDHYWPKIYKYIYYYQLNDTQNANKEMNQLVKVHTSPFTLFLYYNNLRNTKYGKTILVSLGIIAVMLMYIDMVLRIPYLVIFPAFLVLLGIVSAIIFIRLNKSVGRKLLIQRILMALVFLLITYVLNF